MALELYWRTQMVSPGAAAATDAASSGTASASSNASSSSAERDEWCAAARA